MFPAKLINQDYIKLHLIVLIWGFTAILGLLISIPSVELVFYRTLIASVTLWLLLIFKNIKIKIPSVETLKILGTGALIAFHWILFFAAARVSTASVCLAGMATCSLWTSLIEPLFNRRKVIMLEVLLGLIVISGLYIIFKFEFDNALGLFMAISSAFLAALFSVINGQFTKKYNPYVITFYEMMGAWAGTVLFFPLYLQYFSGSLLQLDPSLIDWVYIVILAVVCTVYAFSVSVDLMKRMPVFMINLVINLEPVYGMLLAVLFFGEKEKMQPGFYLGTLIILISVITYPIINKRMKRKALEIDNIR